MKHILLNLKRFDILPEYGGVNRVADPGKWGSFIVSSIQEELKKYDKKEAEFVVYLPEAHIIPAVAGLTKDSPIRIGCQGVYRQDTAPGGNFGAFTTSRTANSMKALGCADTLIGHCEERADKAGILAQAGVTDTAAVNRILNQEIRCAQAAGFQVTYCIGEKEEERVRWRDVLKEQLEIGLKDVDLQKILIAYEPIWAIGPGKTPPGKEEITKTAAYIKSLLPECDVVYGGGLKEDNARMLADIKEIRGGLIALTRFSGEIGFYPEEYQRIIERYMG